MSASEQTPASRAFGFHIPSLHEGFDDATLERLTRLASRKEAGLAPWASWELENSSFGKTLRLWAKYPEMLPLCASSDHGVHFGATCWPNELNSPYRLFLSWNEKKARLMRERHGRNAIFVPHPWVPYRRERYPAPAEDREGTIVFFTHSNAKTTPVFDSLDRYMGELRNLPARFHPVVICLSFHDVSKGMHKQLRHYGFSLISAGTSNSTRFVDRFYAMTRQFRYACSPTIGSHAYYLIESGIPFFLYGERPTYVIRGSDAVKDGTQDLRDYGDDEDIERYMHLHQLLADPVESVTTEQQSMIESYLGLHATASPSEVRNELLTSLGRNMHIAGGLYLRLAAKSARRLAGLSRN